MHPRIALLLLLLVLLAYSNTPPALAKPADQLAETAFCDGFVSAQATSPVDIDCQETAVSVDLRLIVESYEQNTIDNHLQWRIPNEGIQGRQGCPDLPAISRWVRVPDQGRLEVSWQVAQETRLAALPPVIYQNQEEVVDNLHPTNQPAVALNGMFPPRAVEMSAPMIMRGVRMVRLIYYPVRWDEGAQEYLRTDEIQVSIRSLPGVGINEVAPVNRCPSADFDRMLEALLVNPPHRDLPQHGYKPGGYLVVADEEAPEEVLEFVNWKRRAGHPTTYLQADLMNLADDELRLLIREIYTETGFEFLVLIGSDHAQPPLRYPVEDTYYDVYYAQLEGEDLLPDVAVGTFNCLEIPSLICALRRAISYQSSPYTGETEWFTRAGIGVGACSVPDDLSPSYTGKWAAEVLSRRGFDDISTSFFADNQIDDPSRMVEQLYNRNTNFIIVRAHEWDLEIENIQPRPVYPFQFLVSSGTISPPNNGAFNWIFRQGTPDEMKGPSAGFGHYSSPRTNCANALIGGLFESLFFLDINTYGWARNYAVANLARVMVDDGLDLMPYYYSHWRYYGDPSQWCWRGIPTPLTVQHAETIDLRATDFNVLVTTGENDEPAPGALVCLSQGEEFQVAVRTDSEGRAYLTWEPEVVVAGTVKLTVTGEGLYPQLSDLEVIENEVYIAVSEVVYTDIEGGDMDGIANPGETARLTINLINPTEDPSPELVNIHLTSNSPWLEVQDENFQIEALDPGQIAQLPEIEVRIAAGCPDQEYLQMQLSIDAGENVPMITAAVVLVVDAPDLNFNGLEGLLAPGAESALRLTIRNSGHKNSAPLEATLESLVPYVEVLQAGTQFPALDIDDFAIQNGDQFLVRVHGSAINASIANFNMILSNDAVQDTIEFSLQVGIPVLRDPLGPDQYGYIALDNNDLDVEWAQAPEYSWVEISPREPEPTFQGTELEILRGDENDTSLLLPLPFPFRYYGEEFDTLTVCSNGWLAVGDQTNLLNQQNWLLPGFDGAFGMLAVFWDRLFYDEDADGLFTYYDEEGDRFIIEWITGVSADRDRMNNRFQAIIYNSLNHPTATGDSPILFQYHTVNNDQDQWEANAHASVGISSPDGMDGLTYTYWDVYDVTAEPLAEGRAILWTTTTYNPVAAMFGFVQRWVDDEPVAGATVRISDELQTVTDEDGYYRLFGIPEGNVNVSVTAEYFRDVQVDGLEAIAGGVLAQDFVLPHVWLILQPDSLVYDLHPERDEQLTLRAVGEGLCSYRINMFFYDTVHVNDIWLANGPVIGEIEAEHEQALEIELELSDSLGDGTYYFNLLLHNDTPRDSILIPIDVHVEWVDVAEPTPLPVEFGVSAPYPNPFNSSSALSFSLPVSTPVSLQLYSVAGRLVGTLADQDFAAGQHRLQIDGSQLATGTYLLRFEAGDFRSLQKIVLIR